MDKERIDWHVAYFQALQLELDGYKDILEYENEHYLSKESLRIDAVIRKKGTAKIKKNFGQIFKEHNIFEFKSETDSLTSVEYEKANGYAWLYASFGKDIDITNVTLTFVTTMHPQELFKYLKDKLNIEVEKKYDGIYYLLGTHIPTQIIENKMLSEDDNLYLKGLSSKLKADSFIKLWVQCQALENFNEKSAYFDKILKANIKTIMEVMDNMETVANLEAKQVFLEHAKKLGWLDEIAKGMRAEMEKQAQQETEKNYAEITKELFELNMTAEQISKITKLPLSRVMELQPVKN